MKKTYTKPYIAVESFQLDAAIAASCSSQGYHPIGYGENNCGLGTASAGEGKTWAFFNYHNCAFDLTDASGDGNDTPCYHGPSVSGVSFIAS